MLVFVPAVMVLTLILQKYSSAFDLQIQSVETSSNGSNKAFKQSDGPCGPKRDCPENHFSFYIRSGAANAVLPMICFQNHEVLGLEQGNVGDGINVVIVNGKTGKVTKTGYFNMYSGDAINDFIPLLKSIEKGSVVLMASFDEPSSKLNEEARNLIAQLGSSSVHSLGYRDSWVFVGAKGGGMSSHFEKQLKNDRKTNKYVDWPELLTMNGCIPMFME
uniref:protein FAM3C-like n=1 Tax=Semicossyphus pulcher TaxID=241346 RepID=UPI0037E9C77B